MSIMAFTRSMKSVHSISTLVGLTVGMTITTTPSPTTPITSSTSDFAPGVTPPPNQPLPVFDCPRPTRNYCYWEPDLSKDEYYTCWRSGIVYFSSSNQVRSSWKDIYITHTLAYTTALSFSTKWDPTVSFSTLCDGYPRAPPGASPTFFTYTISKPCTTMTSRCVSLEVNTNSTSLPLPPSPTCKIPEKQCASLSSAYESMSTSFWGGWYSSQIPLGLWQAPPCTVDYTSYYPKSTCEPPGPSRGLCTVFPGDITMLYWPPTATPDLCSSQNATRPTETRTSSEPERTAVYEGKTFTSPTVYMVLPSIRDLQSVTVSGHMQSGFCTITQPVTLPMLPQSVTKFFWRDGTVGERASFDFNDVKTISYEAYKNEICSWGAERQQIKDPCNTIWGEYSPTMIVPQQVTEAVKALEGCDIAQLGQVKKWVELGSAPAETTKAS